MTRAAPCVIEVMLSISIRSEKQMQDQPPRVVTRPDSDPNTMFPTVGVTLTQLVFWANNDPKAVHFPFSPDVEGDRRDDQTVRRSRRSVFAIQNHCDNLDSRTDYNLAQSQDGEAGCVGFFALRDDGLVRRTLLRSSR
jgi:hypothetical protein